jgi:hypothetical protein
MPGGAVGGNQNLALGGLGALAGAIFGGGGKSMGGALGGGVMDLLAAMAFQALKGSGSRSNQVPLGLMEPQTECMYGKFLMMIRAPEKTIPDRSASRR